MSEIFGPQTKYQDRFQFIAIISAVQTNLHFGGGSDVSSMHPAVLLLVLLAAVAVLILHRRQILSVILPVIFLTPYGEQILIGGAHLYVSRILVFAGCARLISTKLSHRRQALFGTRLGPIDKIFFAWASIRAASFILLYRTSGAAFADAAFCLDAYGGYLFLRFLIRDKDDIFRATKILAYVATALALCMWFESATRTNIFSYISTTAIVPWLREGKVRAQGTFSNSITAGVFGAVLLPLFFWLWKAKLSRLWGIVGICASTSIVLTSVASTAVMAFAGGVLALFMWPIRNWMRTVRWGLLLMVIGLAFVMKAPVWFVIARVDIIGSSHGWDRAELIDQAVHHFSDWWLIGTTSNASWGNDTWDACNQFVAEAVTGGIASFLIFLALLFRGFSLLGKSRKAADGSRREEWFFWCLGSALFAHVMAFNGVDYFDIIEILWFVFVAMISAATAVAVVEPERKRALSLAAPQDAFRLSDLALRERDRTQLGLS